MRRQKRVNIKNGSTRGRVNVDSRSRRVLEEEGEGHTDRPKWKSSNDIVNGTKTVCQMSNDTCAPHKREPAPRLFDRISSTYDFTERPLEADDDDYTVFGTGPRQTTVTLTRLGIGGKAEKNSLDRGRQIVYGFPFVTPHTAAVFSEINRFFVCYRWSRRPRVGFLG